MAIRRKSAIWYFFRAPIHLYQWHLGWILGHRFVLLTHTGRRTGKLRQTVLEVLEYRTSGPEVVVMGGFGRESDWIQNIEALPNVQIDIGSRHFPACAHALSEEEAVEALKGYEYRNRWMAPVVRFALGRLVGWRYTSSDEDRRRMARQMPFFAFQAEPSG
ncbi:MAG TPA: nitroreductase family deazaflavin-dependent oxidoreductase [Verrucomicrobiae bacterium]|nr:nitroreductase family deazaflavin-dependent oxidoreductase [Verrucomicrobiae bacterium]